MQKISPKQTAFCEYYVGAAQGNASEAARLAGYSQRTAADIGRQLIRKPHVTALIEALSHVGRMSRILTAEERQHVLSEIAADETKSATDRIRAIDTLNKMTGVYLARIELSGSVAVPVIINDIR